MPVGEQGPGTAEQQVRFEVAMDKGLRAFAGMFGVDHESRPAGGGGTGKWVFTSLDQLDGLIKKWTDVRDAIVDRRARIQRAKELVQAPANDVMSTFQAEALKTSLEAMTRHADSMHTYADAYVKKLEKTRSEYVGVEGQNTTRMKNSHGG